METLLQTTIKNAQVQRQLVEIRTDTEDTSMFTVGYIVGENEESITVQSFDPDGFDDGIEIIPIHEIYEIDTETNYVKRLQKYIDNQDKLLSKNDNSVFAGLSITETLKKAKETKKLITINFVYEFSVSGFIQNIDNEYIEISALTDEGKDDGVSLLKIEDIKRISIDSRFEKKLQILR